ncbi:MAG TPA: aspartate-semialdehyde dehydrogenase [Anaeromyxobacteraceae bacterium]|nr:aspartate-semialdehyde dehydrogenase [Anaeromyxobacteraceae bacterium]
MNERPLKLAVVGATGSVGRAVLEDLEAREVAVEPRLFATQRSEVDLLEFRGDELEVEPVGDKAFRGCDAAILAVPAAAARELAPRAWAEGCLAVDLSGAFRATDGVPLVVAGVNDADVAGGEKKGVVASPSGPVVPLALALAPLHRAAGLSRLVATVLHAASGSGRAGVRQLEKEMVALLNGEEPDASDLSHRMGFNLVPQVGAFLPDGGTEEEGALGSEIRRLLGEPALPVSATAIRVPVFYGHGLVLNVRTARPLSAEAARTVLRAAPGVKVIDQPGERVYPMPMLAVNDDAVLAGRVRGDGASEAGLDLFVVADNLRRGAAGNAVRIAETWARSRRS